MRKRTIEGVLVAVVLAYALTGCSDKINEAGSWLVKYDNTLTPRYFNSDSVKVTSSQVNLGLANGASNLLCLGKVPWTEARVLMEFLGLDSVYYASSITSAQLIFTRGPHTLQPPGTDVRNIQLDGYLMDTTWNSSTYTWDSVSVLTTHGGTNIILSQPPISVNDSMVTLNLDTGVVRRWAVATQDTSVKNYGFILIPQNIMGILNLYSALSTTGVPEIEVACTINGIADTVRSSSSITTYVAETYPSVYAPIFAPPNTYRLVQSGTGLRENLMFDLSQVPNFSIVNFAQLTVYADTLDSLYYSGSSDSLSAFYIINPATDAISAASFALATRTGNKYVFNVTTPVQLMLNHGNYGFMLTRGNEYTNVDTRILFDENAPDSLKPKLTITYSPAGKR